MGTTGSTVATDTGVTSPLLTIDKHCGDYVEQSTELERELCPCMLLMNRI